MSKETLDERLKNEYDHWNRLYTYGGEDPNWADGCNLNLLRNHILHTKEQMEEDGQLTDTYYRELPPEVERDYMARADEIRDNAKKSLKIYKSNPNYLYLCDIVNLLNKKQAEDTCIRNVIGYCKGLEHFIEHDDLISMRRHEKPDVYIDSFINCRKKVESILGKQSKTEFIDDKQQLQGQMNILDFLTN